MWPLLEASSMALSCCQLLLLPPLSTGKSFQYPFLTNHFQPNLTLHCLTSQVWQPSDLYDGLHHLLHLHLHQLLLGQPEHVAADLWCDGRSGPGSDVCPGCGHGGSVLHQETEPCHRYLCLWIWSRNIPLCSDKFNSDLNVSIS